MEQRLRERAATDVQVVGLLFYADWCGSCKILDPRLEAVKPEFADQPILFTRVDVTDEATTAYSERYAEWIGLGEIYAKSGDVLDRLDRTMEEDELRERIAQALAS